MPTHAEDEISKILFPTYHHVICIVKAKWTSWTEFHSRVLGLLGQRMSVRRDSGIMERNMMSFIFIDRLHIIRRPPFTLFIVKKMFIFWFQSAILSYHQHANGYLQKLQNRLARITTVATYLKRSSDVLIELGWLNFKEMRKRQKAILIFKILNGFAPRYFSKCLL